MEITDREYYIGHWKMIVKLLLKPNQEGHWVNYKCDKCGYVVQP